MLGRMAAALALGAGVCMPAAAQDDDGKTGLRIRIGECVSVAQAVDDSELESAWYDVADAYGVDYFRVGILAANHPAPTEGLDDHAAQCRADADALLAASAELDAELDEFFGPLESLVDALNAPAPNESQAREAAWCVSAFQSYRGSLQNSPAMFGVELNSDEGQMMLGYVEGILGIWEDELAAQVSDPNRRAQIHQEELTAYLEAWNGQESPEALSAFFTRETNSCHAKSVALAPQALTSINFVTEVQSALAAMGYQPGPVDGMAGGQTAEALAAFRAARGLSGGGALDGDTLESLRTAYNEGHIAR